MQTTKKNILYIILLLSAIIALTGCRLFDAGGQTNMNISESAYAFIPPPRSKFKLVFNPQHNIEGISLSPLPLIEVVPSSSEIDSLELPEQLQTLETDPDLVFREMMTQSRSQAYTWPYWKYPLYAAVGFPRDILATALDAACIGVAYTGGAVGFATSVVIHNY